MRKKKEKKEKIKKIPYKRKVRPRIGKYRKKYICPSITVRAAKWYEKATLPSKFIIKKGGKTKAFFARYEEWKEGVWFGPFKTKKELEELIDEYCKSPIYTPFKKDLMEKLHNHTFTATEDELKKM
jgi:hypothetical protein